MREAGRLVPPPWIVLEVLEQPGGPLMEEGPLVRVSQGEGPLDPFVETWMVPMVITDLTVALAGPCGPKYPVKGTPG